MPKSAKIALLWYQALSEALAYSIVAYYLNSTVDNQPLGLFVWAWKFHNTVNARLKKPIMSWDTVITLYSELDDKVCSLSCLEAEDINENISNPVKPKNYTPLSKILR